MSLKYTHTYVDDTHGEVNENDIIQNYGNRNDQHLVDNDNETGNNGDLDCLNDSVLYTNVAFSQKEPVLELEKGKNFKNEDFLLNYFMCV